MKKIKKELLRRLHPKALKLSSEEREFERNRNSRLFRGLNQQKLL